MSAMLVLLTSLQAGAWSVAPARATVGDTIVIARSFPVPQNADLRAPPLTGNEVLEALAPPRVTVARGVASIAYAVAMFEPGARRIAMPDIELVYGDGRTEIVDGDSADVAVWSVLPEGNRALPAASLGPYATLERHPETVALLVGSVATALLLWGVRRRHVRPVPAVAPVTEDLQVPLDRWMAAGEGRAVATLVVDRVRRGLIERVPNLPGHLDTEAMLAVLAEARPPWPVRELGECVRALERARFAAAAPADVLEVVDRVEQIQREFDARAAETAP
jgi:hypothetical protein